MTQPYDPSKDGAEMDFKERMSYGDYLSLDMLLNATLIPFTWVCAGAVLGYAERLRYPDSAQSKWVLFGGNQALDGQRKTGQRSVM